MNRHFKRKTDGLLMCKYGEVSNGTILTAFDEDTGIPYGNSSHQIFVTPEEFKDNYEPFQFKLGSDKVKDKLIISVLEKITNQLRGYGLLENQVETLNEFSASLRSGPIFEDLVIVRMDFHKQCLESKDKEIKNLENSINDKIVEYDNRIMKLKFNLSCENAKVKELQKELELRHTGVKHHQASVEAQMALTNQAKKDLKCLEEFILDFDDSHEFFDYEGFVDKHEKLIMSVKKRKI